MMKWDQNSETIKKSRSPNSIYFYLKKHNGDEALAQNSLDEYRAKMKGRLKRPNQISYWTERGYSEEEARKKVSESQSNRSKGKKRSISPFESEVRQLMERLSIDYDEAYKLACQRRCSISPRRKEYWLNRGYSNEQASNKVSEWQKSCSPRCIEYWIGEGHTKNEAMQLVSEFQDKVSIKALMKRFDCNEEEALQISNDRSEDELFTMLLLYYTYRVRQSSEKSYKAFKSQIDPDGLRGKDYHLDHIKSIRQCFIEGLSVEQASSSSNLQIIPNHKNLTKGSNEVQGQL